MLKKEFIDGIVENLAYEVKRLWIEKKGADLDFWNKENENKEYINNLVKGLNLENKVEEFKVSINYKLRIIEIFDKKGHSIILRNFGKCGASGLWSIISEEIKSMEGKNEK